MITKKMKSAGFRFAALLAAAAAMPGAASYAQATAPASQPAAAVAATETDVAATDLAKKLYLQLAAGTVDRSLLTPEMSKALSSEILASLVPELKSFGDPASLSIISKSEIAGGTSYKFEIKFPEQQHKIQMYLDAHGLVGGYLIQP